MSQFEYTGEWWLPENADRKIAGTLTFNSETGGVLNLLGAFVDIKEGEQPTFPSAILGRCLEGKITLLRNSQLRSKLTMESVGFTVFQTFLVCVGAHIYTEDELNLWSLSVHYSYLNEWLGINSFEVDYKTANGHCTVNREERIVNVSQLSLDADTKVSFNIVSYVEEKWMNSVSVSQEAYVSVAFSSKQSLDRFGSITRKIQDFLSFAMMRPIYPVKVTGKISEEYYVSYEGDSLQNLVDICLLQPSFITRDEQSNNVRNFLQLFHSRTVFSLVDIESKFDFFVKNWIQKSNQLEDVYNLYFSLLYNSNLYIHNIFLSLAQALEVYHRRNANFTQHYISQEEHERRVRSVLESAPSECAEWLRKILEHNKEKRLSDRVQDILEDLADILERIANKVDGFKVFSNEARRRRFASKVASIRNQLTHNGDPGKKKPSDISIYCLSSQVKVVIYLCLMKEIGFDEDVIVELISRTNVPLFKLSEKSSRAIRYY